MFYEASSFNQPLNNWNVSNVKDMRIMFYDASSFNQPLNNWNVSNVKNMRGMFRGARSFNQPLNKWNLSNLRNMQFMFCEARPKTAKPRSERTCLLRVMMVGMGGNIKSLILVMCRFLHRFYD